MVTYLDVDDPNRVSATAAQMLAASNDFQGRAGAILRRILAAESGDPWGSDEFGAQAKAAYYITPKGSDMRTVDAIKEDLSGGGEPRPARIARETMVAMAQFQAIDEQGAAGIRNSAG